MRSQDLSKPVMAVVACVAALASACAQAEPGPAPQSTTRPASQRAGLPVQHATPRLDRTGRQRVGKASIYAAKFSGRKMADGTRMDPQADSAASKTLPLGSTAKVTNLQTGRSAVVTIRDRGPHVPGRIVDLSPATAAKVGIDRQQGVSKVTVTPITLPQAEGDAGTRRASPETKPETHRSTEPSAPR